jgi:glycosyltransferase involved in cell wall biosynthesis
MRIIIDLQGSQSTSRFRGIGRYTHALALALAKNYHEKHEIIIVLNGMFPETLNTMRQSFQNILRKSNIKVWKGCSPVHSSDKNNEARTETASLLRESFLASLNPDIVLLTSVIEGYNDNSIISLSKHYNIPTAVIFYDAIPFMQPQKYIKPFGKRFEDFYHKKLEIIKNADLIFGISESSCREATEVLQIKKKKVTNISAAADSKFSPREYSHDEKSELFKKLAISKTFLLYSGATDERKNHLKLIEAFSLLPEHIKSNYQLVLAGGMPLENHIKFKDEMTRCKLSINDVIFTGRISDEEFVALYNLCYLYVFPSYHEGFGLPALEAMQCGAATIGANTTSVPEVIGREDALFNPHNAQDIANKIESVLTDETFRISLQKHSLQHTKKFSWDSSAEKVIYRIENWDNNKIIHNTYNHHFYQKNLIKHISKIKSSSNDLLVISDAIAFNHSTIRKRQILVDISELIQRDAKSGIQRVVKNILHELVSSPPNGYSIRLIYATNIHKGYYYANNFVQKNVFYNETPDTEDTPISITEKDIFLGLDMSPDIQIYQKDYLQYIRDLGIEVHFIIYDLLLINHPQWWPNGAKSRFKQWINVLLDVSDTIHCISEDVAIDVENYLEMYSLTIKPKVKFFHLGADIANATASKGLNNEASHILNLLGNTPTFIMVGTVEPRKGHKQALEAFEKIWEQDIDINLVIVGKQGWLVENFIEKLQAHPMLNKKLFWLDSISDEYLEETYKQCICLLAISEGEGFGLPLIEAAQKKLPIIARDLLVFREVAGKHAYYFPNTKDPVQLSQSITQWLTLFNVNKHPKSDDMPWLTWKESTQQLVKNLLS